MTKKREPHDIAWQIKQLAVDLRVKAHLRRDTAKENEAAGWHEVETIAEAVEALVSIIYLRKSCRNEIHLPAAASAGDTVLARRR